MEPHEKRRASYVVTALVLFGGAYLLRNAEWQGSASLHTLMELAATLLAAFVGTMALIRFVSRKDAMFLYIGAGFLGTALLDGYHTVVTSVYFQPYMPSDNPHLVPWSWIASRLFLSIMLFVSWLLWFRHRNDPDFKPNTRIVLSAMVVATLAAFLFFATVPLPSIAIAGSFIGRPVELLPGVFFLMALTGYLYKGSWRDDQFEHWLVLSLIVGVATQTVYMPFSDQLYDLEFNLAHLLKKSSYILVLIGLLVSLYRTYMELQAEEEELHRASVYARSLIEASLDPLVTISVDGKITDVNHATENVTGKNRAELIGTDFSDYFTEPEKAKAGYRQVFAEGFVTDYPLALKHRDGHVVDVLYNASVYRNEAGEVLGVFAAARDITERKKAEQEVVQLNLQNRLILDSAGEGIYGLDIEGRCTFVNPAALHMLGFTADELLGGHSHTVFHYARQDGSPYPESECPVQAACRQGMAHRGRDIYWRRDGSSFPVEFISTPILVAEKITGAVVAFRDITERIQSETALFEAQQVFRTLVENSPDVIVRYDREGRRIYVNPEFERVNHLSAREVVGKKPVEVSTELAPVADVFTEKLMAVMASGTAARIDLSWIKDGRPICWFVRVVPEFDANGNVVSALTIWSDITERKQAEVVLRQSEEALKEAQRIAHLGSWHMDLATNQVFWSEELYKLYGFDPALPPPLYTESMKLFTQESWERLSAAIAQATETGIPYELELETISQKDGSRGWMLARGELVRDARGAAVEVRGVVMDITVRKQAEEQINALNQELEQRVIARTFDLEVANKELESFSYSVSHDLRSPLRAIDGFSRILLEDYNDKLDDEGKRLLNVVRDNTHRMGQLIDDILKFSRAGRLEINFSRIDMEKLAREVFAELQSSESRLQLEIGAMPSAMGDGAMMRQVFVNLLSNAIKFSSAKENPMVKVGGTIEGDEAVYYVKDNGAGFDMQYADKLFGVFQRLHGISEFEGTGIGLAIVKRIITRHGGRVWAEGKVGEGATIYFALPVKERERE